MVISDRRGYPNGIDIASRSDGIAVAVAVVVRPVVGPLVLRVPAAPVGVAAETVLRSRSLLHQSAHNSDHA